jgi:hypothetical protein
MPGRLDENPFAVDVATDAAADRSSMAGVSIGSGL